MGREYNPIISAKQISFKLSGVMCYSAVVNNELICAEINVSADYGGSSRVAMIAGKSSVTPSPLAPNYS